MERTARELRCGRLRNEHHDRARSLACAAHFLSTAPSPRAILPSGQGLDAHALQSRHTVAEPRASPSFRLRTPQIAAAASSRPPRASWTWTAASSQPSRSPSGAWGPGSGGRWVARRRRARSPKPTRPTVSRARAARPHAGADPCEHRLMVCDRWQRSCSAGNGGMGGPRWLRNLVRNDAAVCSVRRRAARPPTRAVAGDELRWPLRSDQQHLCSFPAPAAREGGARVPVPRDQRPRGAFAGGSPLCCPALARPRRKRAPVALFPARGPPSREPHARAGARARCGRHAPPPPAPGFTGDGLARLGRPRRPRAPRALVQFVESNSQRTGVDGRLFHAAANRPRRRSAQLHPRPSVPPFSVAAKPRRRRPPEPASRSPHRSRSRPRGPALLLLLLRLLLISTPPCLTHTSVPNHRPPVVGGPRRHDLRPTTSPRPRRLDRPEPPLSQLCHFCVRVSLGLHHPGRAVSGTTPTQPQ